MLKHQHIDPLDVAKKLGILEEVAIGDKFYDLTTESIAQRVADNKKAMKKKVATKKMKEDKYYAEDKEYIDER